MGILSSLAGLVPVVGPILGGLSNVLGGAANGSQKSQQVNDQAKLSKGQLQLNRDKFATTAPGDRMKTSILASLAKNAQPASVKWGGPGSGLRGEIPQWTGGSTGGAAAAQDPSVQQQSQSTLDDELHQQLNQHDSSIGDAADAGVESAGSKILGAGALGSSILSLLLKGKQGQQPPAVPSYLMGGDGGG